MSLCPLQSCSIQNVNTLAYLVFFWVNTSSEERSLPAVDVLLSVTCQLNLTQVFIHIPVRPACTDINQRGKQMNAINMTVSGGGRIRTSAQC